MLGPYAFREIETKWQRRWAADTLVVRAEPSRPGYRSVATFLSSSPQPHLGHLRSYVIGDAISRYRRMRGDHVLHTTGWDAFSPTAAVEDAVRPMCSRVEHAVRLKNLGIVDTPEPADESAERRRRAQLIFVRMFERGLACRKKDTVSWCPRCALVVGDQPGEDVRCSRCTSAAISRGAEGWYFKIGVYADELLESCDSLTGWPQPVVAMHRKWIGKSEGTEIDFPVEGRAGLAVRVFTRRPETSFGVTYVILAPEHPLVDQLVADEGERRAVAAFREEVARATETERLASDAPKRGLRLAARVANPFTEAGIPLFLANYAVMSYGTGAVMGAPSEDHRDWEFARTYGLPSIDVQSPPGWNGESYTGGGVVVNSSFLDGLTATEARRHAIDWLVARGRGHVTAYCRVPDWRISGRGDTGAPIPIVYCARCGTVPETLENLPVTEPSTRVDACHCPRCGGPGCREAETMDPVVEVAWDVLRDRRPVDQYVCGGEHAALHLFQARFVAKALRDLGLDGVDEPFRSVLVPESAVDDVGADSLIATFGADTVRLCALFAAPVEKKLEWSDRGAEAAARFLSRLWRFVDGHRGDVMAAPARQPAESSPQDRAFRRAIDETIVRVTRDIEDRLHFNTAISAIHELVNALHAFAGASDPSPTPERQRLLREGTETALLLLAPVVPHVVEELWEQLGHTRSIFDEPWPTADLGATEEDVVPIVVQVDGRVRSQLAARSGVAKDDLIAQALADDKVRPWLEARAVVRIVVVPGRLVNIVSQPRS